MRNLPITITLVLLLVSLVSCSKIAAVPEVAYDYNETIEKHVPTYVPNIEYLGQGYNIYFGNPHSTDGSDPGFRNQLIFDFEYEANPFNSLSGDRKWIFPKGVRYNSFQTCTMSYSSKQVESMERYRQSLQAGVSLGAAFPAGSFSASVDYKSVEQNMSTQETLYVESQARCTVIEAGVYDTQTFHPLLNAPFVDSLKTLESQGENEAAYHNFFTQYGTHATNYVSLGSLFGYRFELSVTEVQKMKSNGISVEAAASLYCASASFKASSEKQAEDQFKSSLKTWKSFSSGAPPDPDNNVSKWATQSVNNPLPVSFSLIPYEQVLSVFTRRDKKGLNDAQINNLKSRFTKYMATYCQNYLLPKQIVASCTDSVVKIDKIQSTNPPTGFLESIAFNNKQFFITNIKSSRSWKPDGSNNGAQVKQFAYDGSNEFGFTLMQRDKGIYSIRHISTGKCVNVRGCNAQNDAKYEIVDCADNYCQRFNIQQVDGNQQLFRFQNQNSQTYATIYSRSESENGEVTQFQLIDCQNCELFRIAFTN